jgi:hypothetical protein
MANNDGIGDLYSLITILIAMKNFKVLSLTEDEIKRLEGASTKGASAAKEIRGLRKDILDAGNHGIAELTELHEEMDNSLMGIYKDIVGKDVKKSNDGYEQELKRQVDAGLVDGSEGLSLYHLATKPKTPPSPAKKSACDEEQMAKKVRSKAKRKSVAVKRVKEKGLAVKARQRAKNQTEANKKTSHYDGLKVEIRRSANGKGKMFEIWAGDQKFSNDKYKSISEARRMADQNKMVVTKVLNSEKAMDSAPSTKHTTGATHGAAAKAQEQRAKRERLLASTISRKDLRELTEKQVLEIARQYNDLRTSVRKDESTASKERVSATPENLIRWMRNPGGFDMIGIDSARATTATANLKMDVGSWFKRFVNGNKD